MPTITMRDSPVSTIAQVKSFLQLDREFMFEVSGKKEKYLWVEEVLRKFRYLVLKKSEKSLVRNYIAKITQLSVSQLTRLIVRFREIGKLMPWYGMTKRNGFRKKYIKKYKEAPPEKIFAILNELIKKYPKTQSAGEHNVNSPYGNYLYQCKNCYMCFDSANNENCFYGYDTNFCKSCIDTTYAGQNVENSYQIVDSQILNNCNYVVESNNCQDSWYLFNSKGLKNCFGCAGLQYKQYCILNRQFTQEQYQTITKQLIEELSKSSLNWSN